MPSLFHGVYELLKMLENWFKKLKEKFEEHLLKFSLMLINLVFNAFTHVHYGEYRSLLSFSINDTLTYLHDWTNF